MINICLLLLFHLANLLLLPLLLVGLIRKTKALMQNRTGAPLLQPFYDIVKFLHKTERVSKSASWIFLWSPRVGLAVALLGAILVPWTGALLPIRWAPATNYLLLLYLLSLGKFFTMLAAIDTGSAFGGLGASREATISMLVEPSLVITLGALALGAGSTDLLAIYTSPTSPFIAILAGAALVICALAELSRMPVDDPTTHLELTMVHEAMILEYSGRSLAVIEYTVALRTCILFGLATQTFLHAWPAFHALSMLPQYIVSLSGLAVLGISVAVGEGVLVKLRWRRVPDFLAFAAVLSLLAALIAAAQR